MNFIKNIKKEEFFVCFTFAILSYFFYNNFISKGSLKKNKKAKNILIIGDSISAIYFKNLKNLVKTQWSYLIKEDLKSKDINVDILALGGMTSKWMIGSLKDYLEGKDTNNSQSSSVRFNFKDNFKMSGVKKYDIVIIYTGVNDSFNSANEKGYQYVQQMVDIGNSMGAKVYLVLGYEKDSKFMNYQLMQPNRYITTKEGYIPLVENYQRWQRELPTKIKGAEFIPKFNLNAQTGDGSHPNASAHILIKNAVLNKIDV